MILIDSNVMIDLLGSDQPWYEWSLEATSTAAASNRLAINAVVVAEVAPRTGSLDGFLSKIGVMGVEVVGLGNEAAYAAGAAFDLYRIRRRKSGGIVPPVLPDFLMGGHAQVLGASILTRDPRFYRAYFPSVPLIAPDNG